MVVVVVRVVTRFVPTTHPHSNRNMQKITTVLTGLSRQKKRRRHHSTPHQTKSHLPWSLSTACVASDALMNSTKPHPFERPVTELNNTSARSLLGDGGGSGGGGGECGRWSWNLLCLSFGGGRSWWWCWCWCCACAHFFPEPPPILDTRPLPPLPLLLPPPHSETPPLTSRPISTRLSSKYNNSLHKTISHSFIT